MYISLFLKSLPSVELTDGKSCSDCEFARDTLLSALEVRPPLPRTASTWPGLSTRDCASFPSLIVILPLLFTEMPIFESVPERYVVSPKADARFFTRAETSAFSLKKPIASL